MQIPTDKEIQERFDDLPQEVRAAIQAANMTRALQDVGGRHGLHIDQLGLLEDEALLVMLGFSNPATFPERVQTTVRVDTTTAQAIAEEISAELFVPIRTAMRTYMEERLKRGAQLGRGELLTSGVNTNSGHPMSSTPAQPTGPTVIPASGGGKTFLPPSAQPVLHPTDTVFAQASITTPKVTDFSAPGALQTPAVSAARQYAADPYREAPE